MEKIHLATKWDVENGVDYSIPCYEPSRKSERQIILTDEMIRDINLKSEILDKLVNISNKIGE